MKNRLFIYICIGLATTFLLSCNPDCENYTRVTAEVTPKIRLPGEQVLVATSPADFLKDKELYIEKTVNGELKINDSTRVQSEVVNSGRVVTLPMDVQGVRNFYIKDNDCGGFIPITENPINIIDQNYINQNKSLFITPSPPQVIIPNVSISPPTNIINTWFSPNNRDYCIWFFPELSYDQTNNCYTEKSALLAGDVKKGIGSLELRAGCNGVNDLYNLNPVTGIIDKKSGFVSFSIDRTSKGLGMEHFEGAIITPSILPKEAQIAGICKADPASKAPATMMVVTSKETGRQMILFREAVDVIDVKSLSGQATITVNNIEIRHGARVCPK